MARESLPEGGATEGERELRICFGVVIIFPQLTNCLLSILEAGL